MSWTRMAGSLVLLYAVLALLLLLQGAAALRSVREKQIKLEDIERDNLQTELLKQQRVEQHQHPAYQQAAQQAAQQAQQAQQEHEPAYSYQPQHHFRYEQAPHHHQHHPHHQLAQHHQQQTQQQLLYQAAAAAGQGHPAQGVVPTHIMYLIMPNGNVAAFQLAPHPNHIQAYYSPSAAKQQQLQLQQAMLGTLYHQHAAQPALQYYQPQYVAAAAAAPAAVPAQRYQPAAAPAAATVHHQPTLSFTSQQAHQLHAQHFRELSEQPAGAEYASAGPEQQLQLQQQQHAQAVQQSHKSLYGAGVKATASPPLKGSFSTQTGQSYANFRQYG